MVPDRWTSDNLLGWWIGPPARIGRRPRVDLPPPMLDFYQTLAGYDEGLIAQNTLLAPAEVTEVEGLLVFWIERDETSEWSTDGVEVYERTRGVGDDWHPTETGLTDFLVSIIAFELVLGAPHLVSVEDCSEPERLRILEGLRELPMPGPFLDSSLLAGEDVLAFAGEGFAYVAVRRPEQLVTFERRRD